jgi:acetyl esterase/lipase
MNDVPPCGKGPRVFLDYDQAELDAAYDQSVYAPNMQQILGRYATSSATMRARIGAPKRVAYGSSEIALSQSREFAAALDKAGKPIKLIVAEGYNHLEIMETLGNPYGPFGRAVLEQMQIA